MFLDRFNIILQDDFIKSINSQLTYVSKYLKIYL